VQILKIRAAVRAAEIGAQINFLKLEQKAGFFQNK
jgi:hypothetical protein